jgi:hypothetical protein
MKLLLSVARCVQFTWRCCQSLLALICLDCTSKHSLLFLRSYFISDKALSKLEKHAPLAAASLNGWGLVASSQSEAAVALLWPSHAALLIRLLDSEYLEVRSLSVVFLCVFCVVFLFACFVKLLWPSRTALFIRLLDSEYLEVRSTLSVLDLFVFCFVLFDCLLFSHSLAFTTIVTIIGLGSRRCGREHCAGLRRTRTRNTHTHKHT